MKLKVCGMKYKDNITEVASLQPNYLGFIFHNKSARYFNGTIPKLPKTVKKVGVFVDASINEIIEKVNKYNLQAVQLHGNESSEFCKNLNSLNIEIIKVLSIKDTFDFSILNPYESVCDYYLFDTKGQLPGGNGYAFNWNVLKDYPSDKHYFLSGGIGLEETENLQDFLKTEASNKCYAIDVNSKFEIEPGLKNIELLKKFKSQL